MKQVLIKTIDAINLPKHIAHHIAGEDHTDNHRRLAGVAVMAVGVGFVKLCMVIDSMAVHFMGELVGFAIHGIGLIPFASKIEKQTKKPK